MIITREKKNDPSELPVEEQTADNHHFDVIVVGAGNAGLTAAAQTSRAGLKTLVLEKNAVPGGSATSFVRGRFEFEAALHELASVGSAEEPGKVRRLFEDLGTVIHWRHEQTLYRVIADGPEGYDETIPTGVEAFCRKMDEICPGCYENVLKIFDCGEILDGILGSIGKDPKKILKQIPNLAEGLRIVTHSVDECLDALGIPEKVKHVIETYWPYLGESVMKLDFGHFLLMLTRYVKTPPAMPAFRSHELSLALEKVILDCGGRIDYQSEVTGLILEKGLAKGVMVGEERYYADYVIANTFPQVLYKLAEDPSQVPVPAKKLINARKINRMFFSIYLGLNRSPEELGIRDYSVFFYPDADGEKQYDSMKNTQECFFIVNCLNRVVDGATPEGTCSLFFTTLLDDKAWGNVRPQDYKRTKNRIARQLIQRYEAKMGISIQPYIEEIAVGAPPTFARYLNTPNGTPYGYEYQPWDSVVMRNIAAHSERHIPNLFFVGAIGKKGDGYSTTYDDGRSAGKKVVKKIFKAREEAEEKPKDEKKSSLTKSFAAMKSKFTKDEHKKTETRNGLTKSFAAMKSKFIKDGDKKTETRNDMTKREGGEW